MPGWYDQLQALRESGDVELVGLIQEQHPDRCRLFLQWKQMDFPILVDSLNRLGVSAVPMLWALDEHGVVRGVRPDVAWFTGEFVQTAYEAPAQGSASPVPEDAGVAAFLAGDFDGAVASWSAAVEEAPHDGAAWFRLGCALRARHDSASPQAGDAQQAILAWTRAGQEDPRNYIWHRRLQQYGPRMAKPYPFYDWIATAREEVTARGDVPVALIAEPEGAELAEPSRGFAESPSAIEEPDPTGALERDDLLVGVEAVCAPWPVAAGSSVRVTLRFTPDAEYEVHWTNDAGPLTLVVAPPTGWKSSRRVQDSGVRTDAADSAETRVLDFELLVPADLGPGEHEIEAYAVYYVCEGREGECLRLRQDLVIPIQVTQAASPRRR